MSQTPIPYIFMRGGTSRGPYFNRADLPQDLDQLAKVLVAALGSGHPLNIDGIGGAMPSQPRWQCFQVKSALGQILTIFSHRSAWKMVWLILNQPAVIFFQAWPRQRLKWVYPSSAGETSVAIHAVNTGAEIIAKVQTPRGQISYAGQRQLTECPNGRAG